MYWLPKQHKNPTGSRFIVSGSQCTTKTISQNISKALKIVQKSIKFQLTYDHKFKKSSAYWIIDNSHSVHESIQNINICSKAKSVYTADFSTLYTLIPINQLKARLKIAIDLGFKVSGKEFIKCNAKNATWSAKKPKNPKLVYLSKQDLIHWIDVLLDNIYIHFNDKIFKQIVGIPTGSNCSQELANLYLLSYEYEHVCGLLEDGMEEAAFTEYAFRYIDDLLSLNDVGYLERVYDDIYPSEMKLNKTNTTSICCDYLDINITIKNGKFVSKIYDKRQDFNFNVISLPHMSSNVPVGPTYGVFMSQLNRYLVANNDIVGFYSETKTLVNKLVKQGFKLNKLKYFLAKFINKNLLKFTFKFWKPFQISQCY